MLSADEKEQISKNSARKRKGPKVPPVSRRKASAEELSSEQPVNAPTESPPTEPVMSASLPAEPPAQVPQEHVSPSRALVVADTAPTTVQQIASAYCDFAASSVEQSWSLLAKLAATRSPGQAIELQAEFARQACQSLVENSQKIFGLHKALARQYVTGCEDLAFRTAESMLASRSQPR